MNCSGRDIFSSEFIDLPQAPDILLAPGLIDLQVNGFAGADYNSPTTTLESIDSSLNAIFATGVTRFFPTVITAAPETIVAALANLAHARETLPHGQAMEAFHVEGPHISPDDGPRGAHPARWVREPDIEEFYRWQEAARGHVRLVTLSPEWPQAPRYIEQLACDGVVASIGHTSATPEQIQEAVRAGATFSTHLGNAGHPVLPRHRNYLWEQLAEDRLMAGFIVDDFHLPDAFLRVALRAKGIERSVLVTDAVGPSLGEIELDRLDSGKVVLKGGTRMAGSGLRMDRAISNVVRRGGIGLRDAVIMATVNPARAGRLRSRLRGLQPGERADLVRFRWEEGRVTILETYLNGERVFRGTQS